MLFHLGAPPDSLSDEELNTGEWRSLRYPPLWARHLLALPVGALWAFVVLVVWVLIAPPFEVSFAPAHEVLAAIVAVVLATTGLQLLTHPGMGLTSSSGVGFWPAKVAPYTSYAAPLTRRRHVALMLLPLAVLAFLPPIIASAFKLSSGWLVFVSLLSALACGLEGLQGLWAAYRLPRGSITAGRGFDIYWRVPR